MDWKRIGKAVLFPPVAVMIALVPVAAALLVYAMVALGTESPVAIVSYVLAAYTLTVWCVRIPAVVRFVKAFKNQNVYAQRWLRDDRLRVNVSLGGSFLWNTAYAALQIWLGIVHRSFWFGSLGVYYLLLAVMRFFLVRHSTAYQPGERMREELRKYRACGWIFLVMNLALSLIVFFMLYWNRTFRHHMITAITMAAYTFTAFTVAIVNVVRYRKKNSPVFSASKAISLTAACVSMLTLTSTMLTTFNDGSMDLLTQKLMLGGVGIAVSAVVVIMAVSMIVQSTRKLRILKNEDTAHGA